MTGLATNICTVGVTGAGLTADPRRPHERRRESAPGGALLHREGGGTMTSIDMTQTLRPRSSAKTPKSGRKETRGGGIEVERFYTKPGVDVYDTCEWELRAAVITNESGAVVFEQKDVEMPKFWSQMATNV